MRDLTFKIIRFINTFIIRPTLKYDYGVFTTEIITILINWMAEHFQLF